MEQYHQRASRVIAHYYKDHRRTAEDEAVVAILILALDLATEIVGEMEDPMQEPFWIDSPGDKELRNSLRQSQLSAIQEMRDQLSKEGK